MHADVTVDKVPGAKGDFVVTVDGRELWNKLSHPQTRFPEDDEILTQLA